MIKPEILSPAGDFSRLEFAIMYGADAVYLAGNEFGMRTASKNFDNDELKKAVDFAHSRGVRVYVTLNTMPRSNEIERLPAFIERLDAIGVDAVIVADIGVLKLVQRHAPKLSIHISTQTSIVNYMSAREWFELGADRIVLARELSLDEIITIRQKTDPKLEIEAFVHGAMCISYSGRCLLSNFMTARDANRGNCAQSCRWKYALMEEKRPGEYFPVFEDGETFILNSKDMCMVSHIPELVRAGISSFKIEGRVKTEYYNATVTNAYRMALDSFFENPDSWDPKGVWLSEVCKVSHREYYTGFYFSEGMGQHYGDSTYIRDWDVIAIVEECDDDGNACVTMKNRFSVGDELELLEPKLAPCAFTVTEMKNEAGESIDVAPHPQMKVYLKLPRKVPKMSFLRRECK